MLLVENGYSCRAYQGWLVAKPALRLASTGDSELPSLPWTIRMDQTRRREDKIMTTADQLIDEHERGWTPLLVIPDGEADSHFVHLSHYHSYPRYAARVGGKLERLLPGTFHVQAWRVR